MGETLKHAITINERRGRNGGEKEWDRHPRHVWSPPTFQPCVRRQSIQLLVRHGRR